MNRQNKRRKMKRVLFLLAAILLIAVCVFGLSSGLTAQGRQAFRADVSQVDENRSQILLTGKGYLIEDEQAEKILSEQQQKESRQEDAEEDEQEQPPEEVETLPQNEPVTKGQEPEKDVTREQEPVTEAPTQYDPPTEEEPTEGPTQEPTTREPATQEPTTQEPMTEEPTSEEPTTEEPTTEEPTTEELTTEEPGTVEPITEEPTTEEPTTEEPTTEEPTTEEPTSEEPVDKTPLIQADIKGEAYGPEGSFAVRCYDYNGALIDKYYYTVSLDGKHLYSTGTDWEGWTTYYFEGLAEGQYEICIQVTDTEGNYAEQYHSIEVTAKQDEPTEQRVSLVVEAKSLGFGVLLSVNEQIYENETVVHFVKRMLEKHSFVPDIDGSSYLRRIYGTGIKPGEPMIPEALAELLKLHLDVDEPNADSDPNSLGETDYYVTSGWIYLLNGVFEDRGMGEPTLSDGDEIHIGFAPGGGSEYSGNWCYMWEWQ